MIDFYLSELSKAKVRKGIEIEGNFLRFARDKVGIHFGVCKFNNYWSWGSRCCVNYDFIFAAANCEN